MILEHEANRYASELESKGITIVPVPLAINDQITAVFDHIVDDLLDADAGDGSLASGTVMNLAVPPSLLDEGDGWLNLSSKTMSFHVSLTGAESGEDFMRFANSANRQTMEELMNIGSMETFLHPILYRLWGDEAELCTLNACFVFGKSKKAPARHQDFFSDDCVSLIFPIYDYKPEEASLHYWPYDENQEFYREGTWEDSGHGRRTYNYRRGEAAVFTGNILHQTVPYHMPEEGWRDLPCRALFCFVQAATNRLVNSPDYAKIKENLLEPFDGYLVDPETGEWETPTSKECRKCNIM